MPPLLFRLAPNKNNNGRRYWPALAVAFALSFAACRLQAACAADGSGALDSLWADQAGHEQNAASGKPSLEAPNTTAITAFTAESSTTQPMCKIGAFKDSAFVGKGGWPGVGPFQSESESQFSDGKHDRINLDLEGDQITHAELTLTAFELARDPLINVLNLQMHGDFLLEALGIKPKVIEEFNVQLERKRDRVFKDSDPVNITSGRYGIIIEKRADGKDTDFVLSVASLDANRKAIKQASAAPSESKTDPGNGGAVFEALAPADSAQLKAQFVELINNWQQVKKEAVRTRQTQGLADVLSGKALSRQSTAIKWLVSNHRHYEMDPQGIVVDQFTEILPGRKYMVSAQVKEAYKIIDDQSGKVLKEADNTKKVNYTIEKLSGKLLITDSASLPGSESKTYSAASSTR